MTERARIRPVSVCLAVTATVKSAVDTIVQTGGSINSGSVKEGHLIALDAQGEKVYQALKKGRSNAWIVSCYDSPSVRWTTS